MQDPVKTPHDLFAKASLQDLAIAKDFLRAHLPLSIQQRIDFASLQLTPNEYVLPRLKKLQSDVMYECLIDNTPSHIYFLIEHQRTPHELMAFRQLQYSIALMDQHLKRGHKHLPIIVPLCLYHGDVSPYPHSLDIFECFTDAQFAREVIFKPFQLIDLTILSDAEISQHGIAALFETLLRACPKMGIFLVMHSNRCGFLGCAGS